MLLGDYLCQRLYEAGVHHLFGVPGDFSLGLLNAVVRSKINYVGTCNELNAAYAADGYARLKGIGCVATTYAVGELSAINGVAGSWAESVPVVMLVGAPARRFFLEMPLLHHTLGDYMIPKKMFGMITAFQTLLTNPRTAAAEIDKCLQTCLQEKAPVYLAVPSDMIAQEISVIASVFKPLPDPVSNIDSLEEAVEEVVGRMNHAKAPILLPGVSLIRLGLEKKFEQLVEKTQIPYATMLLTKAILNEENDHFIGLYSGDRSRPEVKKAIDTSDCVIILGEKLTDFNTGGFTAVFNAKSKIYVGRDFVNVSAHTYNKVYLPDFLDHLIEKAKPHSAQATLACARFSCTHRRGIPLPPASSDRALTMHYLFMRVSHFIPPESVIMAETGASLFSCAETMLPTGCSFIGQTFYGSIGYTVGGCLGAAVAAKEAGRPILLFVGDGSFQVTAQDLSTMIRYNVHPIIFLINNDGYTIERVITDNVYNDIQPWKYSDLPEVFGGKKGIVVKTEMDLEQAIKTIEDTPSDLHMIEVILDKWDCNELLKSAGRTMARNNDLN